MKKRILFIYKNVQKKNILTLIVVLLLIFRAMSCKNQIPAIYDNGKEQNGDQEIVEEPTNLDGTVWKLYGYFHEDNLTKEMTFTNLQPVDCEDCYTLWFDTDYTCTAISVDQRIRLDFRNLQPDLMIEEILYCARYDKDGEYYCDVTDFRNTFVRTGAYSVTEDELMLFTIYTDERGNNAKSSYLHFKRIDRDPPTTLRGIEWKLSGMVDTQTNELVELEPANCQNCYTVTFWGDSVFSYKSIAAGDSKNLSNLELLLDPCHPFGYGDDREPLYAELWCGGVLSSDLDGECVSYEDSYLFRYGIANTKSYELTENELKLFFDYQDINYYLLFKLLYK